MNPVLMLKVSSALLALTAIGGIVMGVLRAKYERPPHWLAMAHGLLATAGLTLLFYAAFVVGLQPLTWFGLVLLVATAAAGIYMNLVYHVKMRPLPRTLIIAHGFVALIGLFLIALGSLGAPPAVS